MVHTNNNFIIKKEQLERREFEFIIAFNIILVNLTKDLVNQLIYNSKFNPVMTPNRRNKSTQTT
jgi:hypothetical protein